MKYALNSVWFPACGRCRYGQKHKIAANTPETWIKLLCFMLVTILHLFSFVNGVLQRKFRALSEEKTLSTVLAPS